MNLFYPLKTNGSKHDNLELRYSLRSVESNLSGVDQVYIATEQLPTWLTNVEHIQVKDIPGKVPDWNIQNKICQGPENFLFFNDDHFLLAPFNANTFPNYHNSTLDAYCKKRGKDGYGRRCLNTLNWLNARNLPTKHFDIHYPIIYNRQAFQVASV